MAGYPTEKMAGYPAKKAGYPANSVSGSTLPKKIEFNTDWSKSKCSSAIIFRETQHMTTKYIKSKSKSFHIWGYGVWNNFGPKHNYPTAKIGRAFQLRSMILGDRKNGLEKKTNPDPFYLVYGEGLMQDPSRVHIGSLSQPEYYVQSWCILRNYNSRDILFHGLLAKK